MPLKYQTLEAVISRTNDREFDDLTRVHVKPSMFKNNRLMMQSISHGIVWKLRGQDKIREGLDEADGYEKLRTRPAIKPKPQPLKSTTSTNSATGPRIGTPEFLPRELLDIVLGYLDNVSRACLANTTPLLHRAITFDRQTFSLCENWLLTCRLFTSSPSHPAKKYPCCFCKVLLPRDRFVASPSHQIHRDRIIDNLRVVTVPSTEFYCWQHKVRTQWMGFYKFGFSAKIGWVQVLDLACLHCGEAAWDTDGREAGCGKCGCETCPRARLPKYLRLGPRLRRQQPPKLLGLLRADAEHLWAREDDAWKPIQVEDQRDREWHYKRGRDPDVGTEEGRQLYLEWVEWFRNR